MQTTAKRRLQNMRDWNPPYIWGIIVLSFVAMVAIARPDLLDVQNLISILQQASNRVIMALGAAGILLTVGADLSLGRILGLCMVFTGSLVQSVTYAGRMWPGLPALPLWMPLLVSILIAMLFCAFNGLGVAVFKLQSYIMTTGTQLIAYGAMCLYVESGPHGAAAISTFAPEFINLVNGGIPIAGEVEIPYLLLYGIAAALLVWLIWTKTPFGRNMRAVGAGREAAAASGIKVNRTIMGAFAMAGVLYGIAGYLDSARYAPLGTLARPEYTLNVLTACLIGGMSLQGGAGTVPGVVMGVVLLQFVNYTLAFLGVGSYYQYVIKGLLLILAASVDVRRYLLRKQRAEETEQQEG